MKKIGLLLLVTVLLFACPAEFKVDATEITSASQGEIGVIVLEWNQIFKAVGEVQYVVLRSTEEGGEYTEITEMVSETRWVDSDDLLNAGGSMWYKVRSVLLDSSGKSLATADSAPKEGKSLKYNTNLTAVTGLSAVAYSENGELTQSSPQTEIFRSIKVSWDAHPDANYYKVQKKDSEGNFLFMTTQNDPDVQLVVSGTEVDLFDINGDYLNGFKIVPFIFGKNGEADSAGVPSEEVSVDIAGSINNMQWETIAEDAFRLTWDPVGGVSNYKIERTVDGTTVEINSATPAIEDLSLDPTKEYTYSFGLISQLKIEVGGSEVLSILVYCPAVAVVNPKFFSQTEVIASQGTFDAVTLSWQNAEEKTITEYKIYREKIVETWINNAGTVYFSTNQAYTTAAALMGNKVDHIASNSYADVNELLYIGSVSALNAEGEKDETMTWADMTTGLDKAKPGKYRYYVVGKNQIISSIGYREITNQEFIQLTNRYLDLAIRNRDNDGDELSSQLGGTYQFEKVTNVAVLRGHNYNFSNFNMNGIIFTSQDFKDDAFEYHAFPSFWKTKRVGSITVSGLYSGTLNFFLVRGYPSRNDAGGFQKANWNRTIKVNELDGGSDERKTQGWYVLDRNGASTTFQWLTGYNLDNLQSEDVFNNASDAVHYKVEPDYNSDYTVWE